MSIFELLAYLLAILMACRYETHQVTPNWYIYRLPCMYNTFAVYTSYDVYDISVRTKSCDGHYFEDMINS